RGPNTTCNSNCARRAAAAPRVDDRTPRDRARIRRRGSGRLAAALRAKVGRGNRARQKVTQPRAHFHGHWRWMTPWSIEQVRSAEQIDAVLAIEEASFTNPWTRVMYLAELENAGVSYCFLAKAPDGQVVGFCSFWRVLDELHINNLAVLPEFRRRGIATELL